jgi:hypothetical protein
MNTRIIKKQNKREGTEVGGKKNTQNKKATTSQTKNLFSKFSNLSNISHSSFRVALMANKARSAVIDVSGGTLLAKGDWLGLSMRIASTKIDMGTGVGGDDGGGEVGQTQW